MTEDPILATVQMGLLLRYVTIAAFSRAAICTLYQLTWLIHRSIFLGRVMVGADSMQTSRQSPDFLAVTKAAREERMANIKMKRNAKL